MGRTRVEEPIQAKVAISNGQSGDVYLKILLLVKQEPSTMLVLQK